MYNLFLCSLLGLQSYYHFNAVTFIQMFSVKSRTLHDVVSFSIFFENIISYNMEIFPLNKFE